MTFYITKYVSRNSLLNCSQRPRSSSRTNHQRGEEQQQQRYMREKYSSDLIVPYKRDRMPVAKHKVYEVIII